MDHGILCQKMQSIEFRSKLIKFLQSYLFNHEKSVASIGYYTDKFLATYESMQGSNSGLLSFSLFISDISLSVSNKLLLFAYCLNLFKTLNIYKDCELLQQDLQKILRWCTVNNLPWNINKCEKLLFPSKLKKSFVIILCTQIPHWKTATV